MEELGKEDDTMGNICKRFLILLLLTALLLSAFGIVGFAQEAEPTQEPVCYDHGDVNRDGEIDGRDAVAGKFYADAGCLQVLTVVETSFASGNHAVTEVRNAVAPTCIEEGYTGDTYCVDCDELIEMGSILAPTGAHVADTAWNQDEDSHWHNCTTEGCTEKLELAEHSFAWVVDQEATEAAPGSQHEECVCGRKRSENTEIPKLEHVHTGIQEFVAVPATCVKEGTVEHWTCSSPGCQGNYYGDPGCQVLLETIVVPVDPENHAGGTQVKNAREETCSEEGYTGDTCCTGCKAVIREGEKIPATGKHTPKKAFQKDDVQHWKVCAVCDEEISGTKEDHDYVWVVDEEATEDALGAKHQECVTCADEIYVNTIISKLDHTPVRVAGKAATCGKDGVAEHFYCENCDRYFASDDGKVGRQITEAETVLKAAEHIYGSAWVNDAQNHWHTCPCGKIADEAAHTFALVGAVEATNTMSGYTGDETCTDCGYVKTVGQQIPSLGDELPDNQPTENQPAETERESKSVNGLVIWMILLLAAITVVVVILFRMRKEK